MVIVIVNALRKVVIVTGSIHLNAHISS